MRFDIIGKDSSVSEPPNGPQGRELSYFIPDDIEWQQLNYGQGEGQARIFGCEWGFYFARDRAVTIMVHAGAVDAELALTFAKRVAAHLFGSGRFEVRLVGTNED